MTSVRITTGSRLHFGLVRLPPSPDWADDGQRYFGGAGLMIDAPGVSVSAEPASTWSASGPMSERALGVVKRLRAAIDGLLPVHIAVEQAAPEHAGLGTGTQFELAVAASVTRAAGYELGALRLASTIGRGARSAIGVHGFNRGGFLADAGKRSSFEIGALAERIEFPAQWRIALIGEAAGASWHGPRERDAFAAATARDNVRSERMEQLIAEALIPAVRAADLAGLGAALGEYNALAGEQFRDQQGGIYSSAFVADAVRDLRQRGVTACGQSSWGPTVFAVVEDDRRAQWLQRTAAHLPVRWIARGLNRGAMIAIREPEK